MTNWQTKRLGELTEKIGSGVTPRGGSDAFTDSGVLFIRSQNIKNNRVDTTDKKYIPNSIDEKMISSRVFYEDILYNITGASIGRSALYDLDEPANVNQHVCIIRLKNDNPKFIQYALSSSVGARNLWGFQAGGNREGLNFKQLASFKVSLPEKPEQERIVGVLEVWDEYIEQLERKIALKEQLKIALMQQIFLRKLRLPGYVNNWREIKLEEAANIERGKSLTSNELVNGLYPVIAGGKTSPYCHAEYTHEDVITVSASGANAGYVAYQPRKIWASDCSVAYARTGDYETLYIYYWLYFMQDRIYGLQTGGAQPHVQPSDLRRLKISVPDKEGQLEIIALLGSVDLEINSLEKMKQQLLLQKKYLLQNLITGKIRTPENMEITR